MYQVRFYVKSRSVAFSRPSLPCLNLLHSFAVLPEFENSHTATAHISPNQRSKGLKRHSISLCVLETFLGICWQTEQHAAMVFSVSPHGCVTCMVVYN